MLKWIALKADFNNNDDQLCQITDSPKPKLPTGRDETLDKTALSLLHVSTDRRSAHSGSNQECLGRVRKGGKSPIHNVRQSDDGRQKAKPPK